MTHKEILDELKVILADRLMFDAGRVAEMTPETRLSARVEGSLGLDSLDFLELSIAIEHRFGIVIDGGEEDLTEKFLSLDSLARFVLAKMGHA